MTNSNFITTRFSWVSQLTSRATVSFGLMLLLFIAPHISFAQDSTLQIPLLNGHQFIPATTVPSPFTESQIYSNLGIGNTQVVRIPDYGFWEDEEIIIKGDLTTVLFDIGYQQSVKDWLALNVAVSIAGRLGTDAFSLLSSGVTAGTVTSIGWLVKPYHSASSAIAVYVGAERGTYTVVTPGKFVEDVINGNPAVFSDKIPSTQLESSVRIAHGFNELVGAKVFGTVLYGERTASRDSEMDANWKIGGSLSLDPRKKIGVPIGVLASFTLASITGGQNNAKTKNSEFQLKLDYIAPADYRLGISLSWSSIPSIFEENYSVFTIQLNSRFYF